MGGGGWGVLLFGFGDHQTNKKEKSQCRLWYQMYSCVNISGDHKRSLPQMTLTSFSGKWDSEFENTVIYKLSGALSARP